MSNAILQGAYWLVKPGEEAELAIVACGPVLPEVIDAHCQVVEDTPDAGLLVVTSPDRIHREWIHSRRVNGIGDARCSHIERMLQPLSPAAGLVTILEGHAATLSWLGAVRSHCVIPLGVEGFGQSGDIPDLYRAYGLDADAILTAVARLCTPPRRRDHV
jgi:pyruvate dehydrogenase E1 component